MTNTHYLVSTSAVTFITSRFTLYRLRNIHVGTLRCIRLPPFLSGIDIHRLRMVW